MRHWIVLLGLVLLPSIASAQTEREWQSEVLKTFRAHIDPATTEEYVLDDNTRVDLVTSTHAIEIDFDKKVYEGIGQALFYGEKLNKSYGVLLLPKGERDVEEKYFDRFWVATRHVRVELWTVCEGANPGEYHLLHWKTPTTVELVGQVQRPYKTQQTKTAPRFVSELMQRDPFAPDVPE